MPAGVAISDAMLGGLAPRTVSVGMVAKEVATLGGAVWGFRVKG